MAPVSDLKPALWDYADFVRESAWKWIGSGPKEGETDYYLEVDRRRDMGGSIVRTGIATENGAGAEGEKSVLVERLETEE